MLTCRPCQLIRVYNVDMFTKGKRLDCLFVAGMAAMIVLSIMLMECCDWFGAGSALSDEGYNWGGFLFLACLISCGILVAVLRNWKETEHSACYLLAYFIMVMDISFWVMPPLIVSCSPKIGGQHMPVPDNVSAMSWSVSFAVAGFIVSCGKIRRRASSYAALRIAYGWYGMLLCLGAACAASALGAESDMRRVIVIAALAVMIVCFLYMIQGLMLRYGTAVLNRTSEMLWAMHLRRRQFSDWEIQAGSCFAGLEHGSFSSMLDENPTLDAWSLDLRHELGNYLKGRRSHAPLRWIPELFGLSVVVLFIWNVMQLDWGNMRNLYAILHEWVKSTGLRPYEIAMAIAVAASCVAIPYNVWAYYLDTLRRLRRYFKHHPPAVHAPKA
ncbi:hypothetical protein B1400_1708 [Bifidobacterium italicum]|uniref:Uncharacterized protein n=2 Tax=Bifidobacterium italicum TaxID=1960968 RepID=A0A2A2EDZ7_9BIFI|nr:hypothetical protein B1400_1708 [Bifidobacterium italicum]